MMRATPPVIPAPAETETRNPAFPAFMDSGQQRFALFPE
jgi:hypothetical protein